MYPGLHTSSFRLAKLRHVVWLGAVALLLLSSSSILQGQRNPLKAEAGRDLPDAPGYAAQTTAVQSADSAQSPAAALSGTIVDSNGDVVEGATVVLSGPGGNRTQQSDASGGFAFRALPAGRFRLSVTGAGMIPPVVPDIVLHAGEVRFLPRLLVSLSTGVTEVHVTANQEEIAEEEVHTEESQRVLGVFPNFYSVYDINTPPLSTRQKFQLAFRNMIDPTAFAGAAALAAGEPIENAYPGYGTGVAGYVRRFGAAYANDFDGRMLGSAVFPSLFHQDPRYFYKGTGSTRSRAFYAIAQTFYCRSDGGRMEPNYSEVLGSFATGGLSNLYYPAANRGVSLVLVNGLIAIGGHAGTNLVREFILKGFTTHTHPGVAPNP